MDKFHVVMSGAQIKAHLMADVAQLEGDAAILDMLEPAAKPAVGHHYGYGLPPEPLQYEAFDPLDHAKEDAFAMRETAAELRRFAELIGDGTFRLERDDLHALGLLPKALYTGAVGIHRPAARLIAAERAKRK